MSSPLAQTPCSYLSTSTLAMRSSASSNPTELVLSVLIFHQNHLLVVHHKQYRNKFWLPTIMCPANDDSTAIQNYISDLISYWTGFQAPSESYTLDSTSILEEMLPCPLGGRHVHQQHAARYPSAFFRASVGRKAFCPDVHPALRRELEAQGYQLSWLDRKTAMGLRGDVLGAVRAVLPGFMRDLEEKRASLGKAVEMDEDFGKDSRKAARLEDADAAEVESHDDLEEAEVALMSNPYAVLRDALDSTEVGKEEDIHPVERLDPAGECNAETCNEGHTDLNERGLATEKQRQLKKARRRNKKGCLKRKKRHAAFPEQSAQAPYRMGETMVGTDIFAGAKPSPRSPPVWPPLAMPQPLPRMSDAEYNPDWTSDVGSDSEEEVIERQDERTTDNHSLFVIEWHNGSSGQMETFCGPERDKPEVEHLFERRRAEWQLAENAQDKKVETASSAVDLGREMDASMRGGSPQSFQSAYEHARRNGTTADQIDGQLDKVQRVAGEGDRQLFLIRTLHRDGYRHYLKMKGQPQISVPISMDCSEPISQPKRSETKGTVLTDW